MTLDWRPSTWGDEIALEYGKAIRGYQEASGGYRVFGTNGPVGWTDKALAQGPGVILGRKGAYRGVHFSEEPFWVIDTAYYVRPLHDELDMRWLYYSIQFHQLGSIDDGSPIPSTTRAAVYVRDLDVPELEEQKEIASVLSALDDKIEVNRRMNETLEALAQAVFKDWFVDFGPTRRKMEGEADPVAILGGLIQDAPAEVGTGSASGASANNAPTRAATLAALFPGSFGDDGLPEGWEDKGLDEVAEFLNGLALQKYPATGDNDLPVIKIAELRGGITAKTNRANRAIADKYLIKDGDFLFSWSGSLMAKFWTEGEGALNQHLFKVSSVTHPRWFYSQWVHHHMAEFQTIAASKATTMGHIQRGHLSAARVIVPPKPTLDAMTAIFEPFIERIIHNDLENRTLAETRDYLLPKLMSGAVRVRDAAAVVEGADA